MIVILSRRGHEMTTESVGDWIEALGGEYVRLNAEDLWSDQHFSMRFGSESDDELSVLDPCVDRGPLNLRDVRVVWYRRWAVYAQFLEHTPNAPSMADAGIATVQTHLSLQSEVRAAGRALMSAFADAHWLSDPESTDIDKAHALRVARRCGLVIPEVLLTTSRSDVLAFLHQHPRGIITKTLGPTPLSVDFGSDAGMATYTARVDASMVNGWPETFAASLFQSLVTKRYEVRVFVLGDQVYPMAIFSQDRSETALDFRQYQEDRPNRYVPYKLDDDDEQRVLAMMRALGLETGSIDLIRSTDGELVFLEVNPVGQFGMVSYPCNYHLERRVAQYLIDAHDS